MFWILIVEECSDVCTMEYNPQCGTDGETYSNPCMLKYANCESNGEIELQYPGQCKSMILIEQISL